MNESWLERNRQHREEMAALRRGKRFLVGRVFGRLTVIERAEQVGKNHCWLCVCECGTTKVVVGRNLMSGGTQSCGCKLREHTESMRRPKAALNAIYTAHVNNGRVKQLGSLDRATWERIIHMPCHYCGCREQRTSRGSLRACVVTIVGVDRIDNDRGYTEENCVPCCGQCNRAKGTLATDTFVTWVNATYQHLRSSGRINT